jgi:hypothetical protein
MIKEPKIFISGPKTVEDWKIVRKELIVSGDAKAWQQVFNDFFVTRLKLRYFQPIEILQKNGTLAGEGFSIAAIQCSLIEFLESTVQGKTYRHQGPCGKFEYKKSSAIFTSFLTTRAPFKKEFSDSKASEFYLSVRCGLLHDAQTKNGWRIKAKDSKGRIIDATDKIVFRDNLQKALCLFIEEFGKELRVNKKYQDAFIRKYDALCRAAQPTIIF